MNKKTLMQYNDLKKELFEVQTRIEQLERQIATIESEKEVIDRVKGGMGGIQTFKIEGFPYPEYNQKKMWLRERKKRQVDLESMIEELLADIETYLLGVKDSHIRRIIELRIEDGLSWRDVAEEIGGGNTEDSVRMALDRYIDKNN